MSVQWNDNQLKAINGRDGTMLVSAAAGSGKTAVLVERVIRRLCDEERPCSIENLLIVTFTRAAAAQMKEKITAALRKKTAEEPENKRLRKSLFMLPYANISTIDSFCINLVRDNYHALDISPDFLILDGTREEQLKAAAVTAVINDFHENRGDEFRYLNGLINSVKSDKAVIEAIKKLYETSRAYTFPRRCLENIRNAYLTPVPVSESVWGRAAIDSAIKYLKDLLDTIGRNIELASSSPDYACFSEQLKEDRVQIESLLDTVFSHDWEAINGAIGSLHLNNRTAKSKEVPDEINNYFNAARAYARSSENDFLQKKLSYLFFTEEEHARAMEKTAPAVVTLIDAVFAYEEQLKELKSQANAYSFEDVLHFTLDLLVRDDGSGAPVRTELAERIAQDYDEILVDEYQDVSKAQDAIFAALSRDDKNRFMVGDVKQSIYGFRKAMPEVFTDLRKSMYDYDGEHYPARVDLSANYRSRKGITDTVNFIFSQIMTEYAGGVDYNEREALNPCAALPESKEICTEVYMLEDKQPQAQALFAANYIKNAIENKMQIAEGEGFRDARYSDFCILASAKKSFSLYSETFRNAGIPLIIGSGRQLFEAPEVSFLISLLRVIDNPVNDVPLTAVMLSPVYGFTTDEISEMRIKSKKGSIWNSLNEYADSGSEKASRFIAELARLRRIAVNLPAGEFTQRIVDESGYRAIVRAMRDPDARLAAVERFISVAAAYEETGVKGISAFVRFIDSVESSGDGPEINPSLTDASNAVTMCTIHKSKGLEYPVVILCECEKDFNTSSTNDSVLVAENTGLGIKYIENGVKYDTLTHNAVKNEISRKERSERLRVLYVALTRPKEKLVLLSSSENWEDMLKSLALNVAKGQNPSERSVLDMKNFSQMIFTALLKHPDAHLLRKLAGMDSSVREHCESPVSFELVRELEPEEGAREEHEETFAYDPALLGEITERLNYEYPYNSLHGVVAKRIASDFEDEGFDPTYFASETPGFTNKTGLTPAQRGTATHRFMQYADYRRAVKDTEAELRRLVDENILTPEEGEAVDVKSVHKFFVSSLADRILALPDDKVFKEYAFTVSLPLSEVYPDIPESTAKDEVIIIQGVADCAFIEDGELVIVDYKTDSASSVSELAVRYAPQLDTYRKCLSQAFNMKVKETLVYSFRFGTQIEIK